MAERARIDRATEAGHLVGQDAGVCRKHGARPPPDAPHHARQAAHRQNPSRARARVRPADQTPRAPPLPRVAGGPSMKAAVIYENGDPGVLRYEDMPEPECPDGFVVVDAEAISIEGGDLLARASGQPPAVPHV